MNYTIINKSKVNNNIIEFLGIFMFFAFADIFSILSYVGINLSAISTYNVVGLVKYGVFAMIFIKSIGKVNIKLVSGILLYGTALVFSCLVNNDNTEYIVEMISAFMLDILPLIVIFLYVNKPEKLLRYMRYAAYIVAIRTWILPFSEAYLVTESYMNLAYGTLVSWAVITYFAFKERKWIDIIFSAITTIIYIVFASRGATLCVAGYLLFCLFLFTQRKQRILLITTCGISTTLVIIYFNSLISRIVLVLDSMNIPSYSIVNILEGNFLYSNSREILFSKMLQAIFDNPFGSGIGYDRVVGGSAGFYAHNMFLELFIGFGVIFGSIITVAIIYIYGYMIFKCKDKSYKALFSVFAIPGFIMLQLSGSLFINYHIIIAVVIYFMYRNRTNKSNYLQNRNFRDPLDE